MTESLVKKKKGKKKKGVEHEEDVHSSEFLDIEEGKTKRGGSPCSISSGRERKEGKEKKEKRGRALLIVCDTIFDCLLAVRKEEREMDVSKI